MSLAFMYAFSVITIMLLCLLLLRKFLLKIAKKHNLNDPVLIEMPSNTGIILCIFGLLFIIYIEFIKT